MRGLLVRQQALTGTGGNGLRCNRCPRTLSACNGMRAGHFVLQMEAVHGQDRGGAPLRESRPLPQRALTSGPPVFFLAGLAVGNGLTDPRTQVRPSGPLPCMLREKDGCHELVM